MNNKRLYSIIAIISVCIFILVGLNIRKDKSFSKEREALEYLKEIKSYKTDLTIDVKNDRENNKYKGRQIYKKDMGYKLILDDDKTFIFQGDDITVKDGDNFIPYTLDKDFDEVYKYGFIGEYIGLVYTNEELQFEKETVNGEECVIISTIIPGNNENLFCGKLYFSIKNHIPKKIVICDKKEKERVVYTYENFNWLDKIDDSEFESE